MKKYLLLVLLTFVFKMNFAQYCLPSYTTGCNDGDLINNFSTTGGISNITNNGTGCNGVLPNAYTYFSNMTVSQIQGGTVNISVQSGPATWTQGFRIWVDWNNDGDFADAGEDVWGSTAAGTSAQTGSFTVPATATACLTRMRVLGRFATVPVTTDYCNSAMSFGECEDYNFLVIASTPCTNVVAGTAVANPTSVCPGNPVTLSLTCGTTTSASGLSYSWRRSTSASGPFLAPVSAVNPASIIQPMGTVYYYRCYVTCNNTGLVDSSTIVGPITVQPYSPTSPCYCQSAATSGTGLDITNVTVGSLNNTSACNSLTGTQGTASGSGGLYSDWMVTGGVPAPVIFQGLNTSLSMVLDGCSGAQTSNVKVYIDFNKNTVFDLPAEQVFANATAFTPPSTQTGTFVAPVNATQTGLTRMRVVYAYQGAGQVVNPCGTFLNGETEDYIVNIVAPAQHDPAVSAISTLSGNCYGLNEVINVTVTNYGAQSITCFNNPITVTLNVNGPNGLTQYTSVINGIGQVLNAYGSNSLTASFSNVNLFNGGTYSINTSLAVGGTGVVNGFPWNDSLSIPVVLLNYRPTPGPTQNLCQGLPMPFGQGLTASGCATPIQDSIVINFTNVPATNPTASNIFGSRHYATGTISSTPLPANITLISSSYTVNNLTTTNGGWANETRFPIFSANTWPPTNSTTFLYNSAIGNPATTPSCYTWTNLWNPSITNPDLNITNLANYIQSNPGANLYMGYHSIWSGNATSNGLLNNACPNPSVARLVIKYQYVPASFEWYDVPTGGAILYTQVPFNPLTVPNAVVNNSNTPGLYPFYVACAGSSACRDTVFLQINPTPNVFQDTLVLCENPVGSNGATFDLTTMNSVVSGGNPPNILVSYKSDQGGFIPITNDTAYLSSTNFVYAQVLDTLSGCLNRDSLYLDVVAAPNTIPFVTGNACYPSYLNTATLLSGSGLIPAGSDTLFYSDPAFSIPHPNPYAINLPDTVYVIVKTNSTPSCSDTIEAYIDVQGAGNYIANQVIPGNYSTCGPVGTNIITLSDGMSDTARTSTDCMKVAGVYDEPDGTNLGSISVYSEVTCPTPFHNGQPYVNRWYEITPTNNDSATVCLFYLDDDFQQFNSDAFAAGWPLLDPSTNLCITKVDGGQISGVGTTATTIPNSMITSSYDPNTTVWTVCFPVSGFSSFYCHTCNPFNAPLPVTLLSFEGKRVDSRSVLSWVTATEQNNSHFVVERSKDSRTFNAISDQIPSKATHGNSSTALSYGYTDSYPVQGHNYYRLQQVDIDGNKSYSKVVDVYYNDETMITLYPNPAEDLVNLDINVKQGTEVKAQLLDATGRIVKEESVRLVVGLNQHKMDISSLADGVYMLKLTNGRGINYTQTLRKK